MVGDGLTLSSAWATNPMLISKEEGGRSGLAAEAAYKAAAP
jgi:hypothetical protein